MSSRLSPRLFLSGPFASDHVLDLDADKVHYLTHVLRLMDGDEIRVFNEKDGEWNASLQSVSKKNKALKLTSQLHTPTKEADLWLCCAPIKKAHFDYMIEKATELGVSHIQPVLTARTQIRDVNQERLHSIATESAEQSERLSVPSCAHPVSLTSLLENWDADRKLLFCAEIGEAQPARYVFTSPSPKTAILIGPEGGFDPSEMEQIKRVPATRAISLGPRILRADTAAIAALSLWQGLQGDWTKPRVGEGT